MARRVRIAGIVLATIASVAAAEYPADGIPAKAKAFTCSLGQGKVTIRISAPHGTDLGIRTPANDFFFVYSCDPSMRAHQLRDIDCPSFANLPRVTIDVATFEAVSVGQPATKRRVFSQAGAYTVLLGKNLETENTEQTVNRCIVQFRPNGIAKH